jgi:hypothetical protein
VLANALAARVALMHADTAAALSRLQTLVAHASRPDLASGLWQSLGSERLLLAELLLRRGENVEALATAALLDHPQPRIYLMYLPTSLAIREEAARRLGQTHLADAFESRLTALADAHVPQSAR